MWWKLFDCAMICYLIVLFHTLTESMFDAPCDIWYINPSQLYLLCWWSDMACVLFLSLYVFQFKSCIVLLFVLFPCNMFRNKIGKFSFFLPSILPILFPPSSNCCLSFFLCFIHYKACSLCVNCSAVINTYCTNENNAVCCFWQKTTYLQIVWNFFFWKNTGVFNEF